ncbi:hypothetical protein L6164_037519 [Bauhinia variegata]|uniref:Uncharacterized protein n=1 Tax=Bauhinia variegata TaxID=167791 RepID=A0ACB9KKF2_BAUVA|nr:hypothetical protein L6164_037519 [Bauhinia variegata]
MFTRVGFYISYKLNGVSEDVIQLRLFPLFVKDKARDWLDSLAKGSISTWADLNENLLSDAWEHYNEILRQCPYHSFEFWIQVQSFYNGLLSHARSMVYATAGGGLNYKTPEQA